MFTEGCSELDWVQAGVRLFRPGRQHISWKEFCRKGYYVVPRREPEAHARPVNFRWFAEGRTKDIAGAAAAAVAVGRGVRQGPADAQRQVRVHARDLAARHDPDNPERPVLNRYIPSWEGPRTAELFATLPAADDRHALALQLPHQRGRQGQLDQRHRGPSRLVDGHYYWLLRMNTGDARDARHRAPRSGEGLQRPRRGDLRRRRFADGAPGVVKSFESSAEFEPVEIDGEPVEIGGCMNMLTPSRPQSRGTSSMAPNSCLVQVEAWRRPRRGVAAPVDTSAGGGAGEPRMKWNLIIDVAACENCNNCALAAKDELVGNDFPGYSAPHRRPGTGVDPHRAPGRADATPMVDAAYLPRMCNHCDDAPCIRTAGAMAHPQARRRHRDHRPGEGQGPPRPRGRLPVRGDRLERGSSSCRRPGSSMRTCSTPGRQQPRCVRVCPTQAIEAVKLDDEAMHSVRRMRSCASSSRNAVPGRVSTTATCIAWTTASSRAA